MTLKHVLMQMSVEQIDAFTEWFKSGQVHEEEPRIYSTECTKPGTRFKGAGELAKYFATEYCGLTII